MTASKIQKRVETVVSAVSDDGLIIETVLVTESNTTAFVVFQDGRIDIMAEYLIDGSVARPIRASNNLIKHGAVVLPSEPVDYGDTGGLITEIVAYITKYVSLSDEAAYLSASYVLLSWVYDAFNELPYLRFRGDYGTGKTRALLVIGSLCHKAFFASGASTVSPIFHTLDTFRGTLVFDEADFRFSDEKAELVKILNNGNAKGFPVLRTQVTQQKEFDPRAFVVFGPKIVGMRRPFADRALESRFLTVEMQPGRSSGVPINLPDTQKIEALQLRNKLLMYRLRNRLTVALDATLVDPGLEPRMNQILLPLLSVVPDSGIRTIVMRSAQSVQAATVSERSASTEGHVLGILQKVRASAEGPISVGAILSAFTTEFAGDYGRPISNRWIGSVLRRLGIALYKSNGVIGLVPGQDQHITALCARYGITDETFSSSAG